MELVDRFRAALEAELAGWDDRVEANVAQWTRLERYLVVVACWIAMAYLKVWIVIQRRRGSE